ncbi:putative LRR receptor-like serine/threonine-protein kinase EFR-like [Capsicum annuum]|nr:putative LRR receptor-like serine/threonine-protein kinase EFR-like [Capsicum annuum]
MEKAFSSFLLIVFLLLHNVLASSAMTLTNITTDQLALLSLRSQIISDPSHFFDENWSPTVSVCHWVGVTCDSRHQRVNSMNLSNMALTGRIPHEFGNLTFLVSLDLESNNFHGNLPQEITRLRRLKFLDLSFNNFSGKVPSWFGILHQLQFLSLTNNSFTGSIPCSFSNISTLETLNLNFNYIEGQIPKVIGSLLNLRVLKLRGNNLIGSIPLLLLNASRLETLDISYNSLQGNIPEGIGNLHNMKVLSIQYNQLMSSIPFKIFNISRIEVIAFTGNSLSGSLPNGLCNGVPILEGLYLSYNKLHGHMPTSLSNCSQLQLLSLTGNEFDGPIHSEIGRLSNLQFLYLGNNHFTGEIPKEISNLIELEELDLSTNNFSGSLDMETFNISGLRILGLTDNDLSGSLPPNIGSMLPNIEVLYLGNLTNLVGTIPHSISNCSKLTILELSYNKLTGLIPNSLGYLTHLQLLNLGENNLTSDSSLSFLTSLTNCRNLEYLSLYLNPLNGILPVSVGNFSKSLMKFYASSCKIRGRIPIEVGNLSSLLDLDLSGNNLVESIPTSIGKLRSLQRFVLTNNKLTGTIGDNFCKLQRLGAIYFSQNQLSGSLPNCLGNITSLREIHVGSNKLSSNIPLSIGKLQDLVVLDLSSNKMVGSLPPEIENLKAATQMDLSMNQFSNEIPREIGGLQNLAYLSLRHNKLQGPIPDSMSNMIGLEFLDLSHNNISGNIPKSLEKLQNLKYFNISVNKLYGEIPSGGPFRNLSSGFFIYNEALCGSSRFSVPPCPTSAKHKSNRKKLLVLFLLLGLALLFVPISFVFVWIRFRQGKRVPQQDDSLSTITRERISYYALLQATDELSESNLIGSGSFGTVYKGVLRSGAVIAVKVFSLQLDAGFKSFDTECEVLRNLRHRNLVKVITSCSNLDFKALVLESMSNGSLEKHLYSHNYFLDIRQRLSIMIDVACVLEYLHHGCSSTVIHCDLKPSNVLLDEDMVAHLSDFGISKLLGEDQCDFYIKTLATLGYIAPEYGLDGLVSTKCDVYSYGIMLLETFTRRKPNEFDGDLNLKQWASYSLPEAVMDIVDVNLVTPQDNQKELDVVASIMEVALDCCAESPARRTNMKDVVGMLQIKIQLLLAY